MVEEQVLKVVITADDKATGKLGKVGAGLKKLSILAAGAAIAGVAVLAAGFVKLGIEALKSGADAQEMLSKLEATFGEASGNMTEGLTEFAEASGRSRFELLGMATDMGAVLKAMGQGEIEAAEMAAGFTRLAVDVGSFNNLPSAEVAQRFTRALTGEFESLKALGVVINETKLEQEFLNMGIEEGAKAASEEQRIRAISNIIYRQTVDAQGDAIKTSGSWTNIMIGLKSTLSDVVTELGLKLIPVLTPLAKMFGDLATNAVPIVADIFDNVLIPALQLLVLTFQRLVAGNFAGAIRGLFPPEIASQILQIMDTMQPLFDFLSANVIPILIAIGGVIAALVIGGFLAMGAAVVGFLLPFLPLIAVIVAVAAQLAVLVAAWQSNFGQMRTKAMAFWNFLKPIFDQMVAFLRVFIPAAIQVVVGFWQNSLLPAIQAVWAFIETSLIPLFLAVADVLSAVLGKAVEALAGLWQNVLQPVLETIWDFIKNQLVPVLRDTLGPVIKWLTDVLFANWKKSFDGIVKAIEAAIGWLKDLATSIAEMELPDWLTPGSPTPFELGLLGIADALKEVNGLTPRSFAFAPVAPGGISGGLAGGPGAAAGLGGVGGTTIILNYAPTLSTASEDELREKLKPILERMGLNLG